MQEVAEVSTPAHIFTAAGETTPSSGRYSGMIGPTMPNATLMMNWTATILHRDTRQRAGSLSRASLAGGGAVSFIRITIGARRGGVKSQLATPAVAGPGPCRESTDQVCRPLCLAHGVAL